MLYTKFYLLHPFGFDDKDLSTTFDWRHVTKTVVKRNSQKLFKGFNGMATIWNGTWVAWRPVCVYFHDTIHTINIPNTRFKKMGNVEPNYILENLVQSCQDSNLE